MTYTSDDSVVEALRATRLAPILHHLNLLTDDELAEVQRYTVVAESAEQAARAYELSRVAKAQEVAADLIETGSSVDEAMLTGAAKRLAPVDDIHFIAKNVYAEATRRARAVAFANVKDLPGVVTAIYEAIAAEVDQIAPALANVSSAQQAIENGKTAEWQRISELQQEYRELSVFISDMRWKRLLPRARLQSEEGAHWAYRRPVSSFDSRRAADSNDDGRASFLLTMKRQPYVPASEAEAAAVRTAWERGEVEEVVA